MRVCKMFVRALVGLVIAGGMWGASANAQAPVVGVSPSSLSFGVPGAATGVASASQPISITVTGSGTATVTSISKSGSGDFTETDNCNVGGTISAPGCVINVTFTPSATGLETATWTITTVPGGATQVALSGALGAIPLFTNSVDVTPSNGNASLSSPVTFGSQPFNLSCSATGTAKISSTPDGLGNVVVDNYLTLTTGPTPTTQNPFGNGTPAGNICTGGVNDGTQQDCFTQAYRDAAGGFGADGDDPDSFASTWGVAPIDVTSAFSGVGNVTATFNFLDEGVVLTGTRLFLVSQCTVAGVVSGGSITGNPVNPNDATTQSQTSNFDNVGGQTGSFTTDVSKSPNSVTNGTTQVTTDFAVPQQLFSQLVKGTSAAPAVCLRLNMETDTANNNAPMCKAFLVQCWDSTHSTLSGDNCISTPSSARNLFDATKYDSLDAPQNTNYLLSACSGINNETCAQAAIGSTTATTMLVGPGILLGGDEWLCPAGTTLDPNNPSSSGCVNQANLNTATPTLPASYSSGNCILTGSLKGDPCPLDTLTQFKGSADPVHGSTTSGKNSIFIPVINVPLPFTQTTVNGRNGYGWVTGTSVTASFVSNQANYIQGTGNPDPNGFQAAPPYSLTYGFALATAATPDTTFPVTGDVTNFNTNANAGFGTPLCPSGVQNPFMSSTQTAYTATAGLYYNLHYFTTDCALTEELLFQPKSLSDANENWAKFRTIAFGVDTGKPSVSCSVPAPNAPNPLFGWYASAPTASCQANDDLSGFAVPGQQLTNAPNAGCDPIVNPDCAVKLGTTPWNFTVAAQNTGAATNIPQQTVQDLAGNVSPVQNSIPTPVDNTKPTFKATFSPSGTTFNVGQTVTAKFVCSDTGSGLATCGNQTVAACQMAPTANPLNYANTTGVAIDTSAAAVLGNPHTLNAVDCAGNVSGSVTYNVVYGSAELLVANIPNAASVKSGSNLTYNIFVLDLGPNTASNVVVTDTIPANATYVSAISGIGSCNSSSCSELTTGSSCSVSGTGGPGSIVTCSTPTVKPVLPGLTGFVIKLVVKVSAPASVKSISDTATVTSTNPDPIKIDNTATASTKVTQ